VAIVIGLDFASMLFLYLVAGSLIVAFSIDLDRRRKEDIDRIEKIDLLLQQGCPLADVNTVLYDDEPTQTKPSILNRIFSSIESILGKVFSYLKEILITDISDKHMLLLWGFGLLLFGLKLGQIGNDHASLVGYVFEIIGIYFLYRYGLEFTTQKEGFNFPNAWKLVAIFMVGIFAIICVYTVSTAWVGTKMWENGSGLIDSLIDGILEILTWLEEHGQLPNPDIGIPMPSPDPHLNNTLPLDELTRS